jgi:ribosomal protein S8
MQDPISDMLTRIRNGQQRAKREVSMPASTKKAAVAEVLKKEGYTIAGYGASGRANTMIQYCGINHSHLDYMIDDAPAKAGFFTPGSHFEIHPSSISTILSAKKC